MTDPASHLIIAGTTRAASTSLFMYLGDHPHICRATIKETRFFLDLQYPGRRLHSYSEGADAYERYFPHAKPGQVRLEATPDYLYDARAAARIRDALPRPIAVFVLRNPVARVVSWYRFGRQVGALSPGLTLEQYVRQQLDANGSAAQSHQAMRSLAQGCYSAYLEPWLRVLGRKQVVVVPYSRLKAQPGEVVRQVTRAAGVDPGFFDSYRFKLHNRSRRTWGGGGAQRAYHRLAWGITPWIHDRENVREVLRRVRRVADPVVLHMSGGRQSATRVSAEVRRELETYYRDEPAKLAALLGVDDWQW